MSWKSNGPESRSLLELDQTTGLGIGVLRVSSSHTKPVGRYSKEGARPGTGRTLEAAWRFRSKRKENTRHSPRCATPARVRRGPFDRGVAASVAAFMSRHLVLKERRRRAPPT